MRTFSLCGKKRLASLLKHAERETAIDETTREPYSCSPSNATSRPTPSTGAASADDFSMGMESGLFGYHRDTYISTTIQLRIHLICVGISGVWPEYACGGCSVGGDMEACAKCCVSYGQRALARLSAQLLFSTYGKVKVVADHTAVTAIHIDRSEVTLTTAGDLCFEHAREYAHQAVKMLDAANGIAWDDVDVPLWLVPHSELRECKDTVGQCYIGMHSVGTTPIRHDRNEYWKRGCFAYDVPASAAVGDNAAAAAALYLHETGHFLGLSHAAGNGETRTECVARRHCLSEYGDSSALMGNDFERPNALTVIARYSLGVLPASAVATISSRAGALGYRVRLKQLSSAPPLVDDMWYLAVAMRCARCRHRSSGPDIEESASGGGDIWLSVRGSDAYSPHWAKAIDHGHDRVRDHEQRHNRVIVDYRPSDVEGGTHSQQWYWLAEGEEFSASGEGPCIFVFAIHAATASSPAEATVGVGASCEAARSRVYFVAPPPLPPAPPLPPSPPPQAPVWPLAVAAVVSCCALAALVVLAALRVPRDDRAKKRSSSVYDDMPLLSIAR